MNHTITLTDGRSFVGKVSRSGKDGSVGLFTGYHKAHRLTARCLVVHNQVVETVDIEVKPSMSKQLPK
jgi:hypothetical protein